jgi:hypothetical protein
MPTRRPWLRAGAAGISVERVEIDWAGHDMLDRRILGRPVAVAALVVVEDRHGDAVCARLGVQVIHVTPLRRRGQRQFVLDLVQDDGPGVALAVAIDLVARDDAVDPGQPIVRRLQIFGRVGPRSHALVDQPAGEAAAGQLGIHVRPRSGDDVEPFLLRHRQQSVDVADAREIVHALLGAVESPVEIECDGIEAVRLHFLKDIAPQIRAWQAVGVELPRPYDRALAVDHQRARVERDAAKSLHGGL